LTGGVRRDHLLWAVLAVVALVGCGAQHATHAGRSERSTRARRPRSDPAAMAARATIPVLCYHQIRQPTGADGPAARPYIVSPARFAAQMRALAHAGYSTVTGEALVAHVAHGARLPPKPVLLTFDDGSIGQYTHAVPVLRRLHFTATFFVMTVVLDRPGWLSRLQVRALDRAGMTIGAHTWDHHPVPGYTEADWRRQLDQPTHELVNLVGHRIRLFAYPYGLWDRPAVQRLRQAGFAGAFQLAGPLDRADPLWTIRRIIVPDWTGPQLLREMRHDF
jgi:peptidoglycan/xylan/chitin deacetylase (PgdA/CDA1 family)